MFANSAMTKSQRARIANLDNRISILAAKVLPLIYSPTQRERYAKALRIKDYDHRNS